MSPQEIPARHLKALWAGNGVDGKDHLDIVRALCSKSISIYQRKFLGKWQVFYVYTGLMVLLCVPGPHLKYLYKYRTGSCVHCCLCVRRKRRRRLPTSPEYPRDMLACLLWLSFWFCNARPSIVHTGFKHTVDKGDLTASSLVFLPLPPECWDYRHTPPCPVLCTTESQISCVLYARQVLWSPLPPEPRSQPLFWSFLRYLDWGLENWLSC